MITFILAVCGNVDYIYTFPPSPPSRAAWIEIKVIKVFIDTFRSPPSRAAWIEIHSTANCLRRRTSPPSRAAWIEITFPPLSKNRIYVAAFTGGVD